MHPQWIRELRDQCVETDTPFFFKSWGDWCPKSHTALFPTFDNAMRWGVLTLDGEFFENTTPWNGRNEIPPDFEATVYHIGKKTAGRLLDGRQWDEFPFMARNG
jgi:protein gp37